MDQLYKTILLDINNGIATITLNRPEVHNALNDTMISELTKAFKAVNHDKTIRIVILKGKGKSFCAGADLNYMKGIAKYGFKENYEDGKKLATLFMTVYECTYPVIAIVHGAAFGGANGLLAACDIVIAEKNTNFAFSEVKLGIAPATISPFVIKRIGEFGAKELMMTGKIFKAPEAEKWHLINRSVTKEEMEETLLNYTKQLLSSAPEAVKITKQMIKEVVSSSDLEKTTDNMSKLIATLRASKEGQEGMAAFLEKRKPKWNK